MARRLALSVLLAFALALSGAAAVRPDTIERHRLQPAGAAIAAPTAAAGWLRGLWRGVWGEEQADDTEECESGDVRRYGLKAIREMPFIGLFEDLKDIQKFEASSVTTARGNFWVVFDNLHSLGRIDEHFRFRDPDNVLVGHVGDNSQFEGLSYDEKSGHFFVVEEVVEHGDTHLHPVVWELAVDEASRSYRVVERCHVNFQLSHQNKGFEGLHFFRDPKDPNRQMILGLCEGNFCKGGSRGREPGNGRMVVAELSRNSSGCAWEVVEVVRIPTTANFQDYSGMSFYGNTVAILSQEDSAMYVGTFDFGTLEFVDRENEQVYHFPRNDQCQHIYCNVEGVAWMDDTRIIVASDKAKATQPYRCTKHDQSVTIFALPR